MVLDVVVRTLWLMIPAYIVNPGAVVTGGGTPMDLGRRAWDGERILGDGKTWRGYFGGVSIGMLTGGGQTVVALMLPANGYVVPFSNDPVTALEVIALLAFGAMTGDAAGSFVKRRMRIPSGGKAFLLDHLGFVLAAWLFVFLGSTQWFLTHLWGIVPVVTVLALTPILHRSVNIIGHRMGRKKVPW